MSGNVMEWCEDFYHISYSKAPEDGSAWLESVPIIKKRVLRGGTHYSDSSYIYNRSLQ